MKAAALELLSTASLENIQGRDVAGSDYERAIEEELARRRGGRRKKDKTLMLFTEEQLAGKPEEPF